MVRSLFSSLPERRPTQTIFGHHSPLVLHQRLVRLVSRNIFVTSDTIPFSTIKEQVGKKNFTHRTSQWVYPTTVQTEDEFHTSDEVPYGTAPDATSFTTIKKQVRKKSVTKKPKKDRVSAQSISLVRRLI